MERRRINRHLREHQGPWPWMQAGTPSRAFRRAAGPPSGNWGPAVHSWSPTTTPCLHRLFFFPRGIAVVGSRLAVVGDHLIGSDQVPFEMLLDDQLALLSGRVDSLTQGTFAGRP